jgi:cell shape-determining protein MreD
MAFIPNLSKIFALGVIISAMLYGGVATLALTYLPLLLKTSHTISRRMRNFLLAYVTFMVAISTVNMVTIIISFAIGHSIFNYGSIVTDNVLTVYLVAFPNGLVGALCFTFASWGADGFMVSILK